MSFPRYPNYKDSGVEWLGEVPEHWRVIPIRRAARLESGHTPSRSHPEYWEQCTIPWFSLADVWQIRDRQAEYIFETKEKVSELGLANSSARLLPKDTVMLSRTASVGFSAIMGTAMATTQDFANWICGPSLLPEFLLFALRAMRGEFRRMMMGSTHNTIYMPDIQALRFALPSVDEQREIVALVRSETAKIDALIAEQQRLIELLKEKRQAVISHAVTKGLNPDAPMKDSGIEWLGEVPAHWVMKRVKHLVRTIEQGWSPQCEGFPAETEAEWGVLKVGCVNGGTFRPSENKLLPVELEPIPELTISCGDLLISRANTRELVGSAAVAERDYQNLMLCDKLYRLRFNPDIGIPRFVCRYLESTAVRGQIELDATGASASMVNIGQSAIMELVIAVPPTHEQCEIAELLTANTSMLDALTAEAQHAIDLLQERRIALISAAVTGQIDVRDLAVVEPPVMA